MSTGANNTGFPFEGNQDSSLNKKSKWFKRPWKQSYRKIPISIDAKLNQFKGGAIKVASAREVPVHQIQQGLFTSVGIYFESGNLHIPEQNIIPALDGGVWARRNIEGWEIVRRDLPKISRYFSVEVPNFGDWAKGSHEMVYTRECYQREVVGPLEARMKITIESAIEDLNTILFSFELDYLFDPEETDFRKQLLLGINLMQQTTGCSDVFPADVSKEEILKTRTVNWEILPQGISDREFVRIITNNRSEAVSELVIERFHALQDLNPERIIRGTNMGTTAYYGAQFADDLVIFENIRYGNALYVMFGDWESLSKLSRTELLKNPVGFERIVHRSGWKRRLAYVVNHHRS